MLALMNISFLRFLSLGAIFVSTVTIAYAQAVEIHGRIKPDNAVGDRVALTLDACSGRYDEALIDFLVKHRIPATIFATKRWLDRNPPAVATLKANLDLFDIENHGEKHIPAVIGKDREVYDIPGHPDMSHLRREVLEGARAVELAIGVPSHWYRGATGVYDPQAVDEIHRMGLKIAGFSVNADDGASLSLAGVVRRLKRVKGGDVIIAHMNKPDSDTAEGLSTGLLELIGRGYVFVRLDQVELSELPAPGPVKP
jgi:peptidoglycan/xylan/chitin deacetylase (PgdA/CDA1 family)